MKLSEIHAREKTKMPVEWCVFRWDRFPKTNDPALYYQVVGAVAPPFLSGKRKGETNWKKRDKTTERTVVLPIEEHKAWIIEWEKRTGKCQDCLGEGQTTFRWSVKDGVKKRACKRCGGTGKPTP